MEKIVVAVDDSESALHVLAFGQILRHSGLYRQLFGKSS